MAAIGRGMSSQNSILLFYYTVGTTAVTLAVIVLYLDALHCYRSVGAEQPP